MVRAKPSIIGYSLPQDPKTSQVKEIMILTHFAYDTIKITYDENVEGPSQINDNCRNETWKGAQLFFKTDKNLPVLEIYKGDRHILLGRAKVVELTPWGAKFEAYWWRTHPIQYNKDGKLSKRQKSGFSKLVRADIVCEF